MRRSLAMLLTCLSIVCAVAASNVRAQSSPRAEANQLHAAIVNGDVESLQYWLTLRHADASAANATEPDITPLVRCIGIVARTLDTPAAGEREPREPSAPIVSLRTLQAMVTLLYEHGARLTDADRRRFSGPVLRWYDDAVSTPAAPAPPQTDPAPAVAHSSSKSAITLGLATVLITTDPRESCNGSGHAVYLVNETQLSVTAKVTMYQDAAGTTNGSRKSDSYTLDPDSSWRLGCDASTDGRSVRYALNAWR
jgi:hypothetical protein